MAKYLPGVSIRLKLNRLHNGRELITFNSTVAHYCEMASSFAPGKYGRAMCSQHGYAERGFNTMVICANCQRKAAT